MNGERGHKYMLIFFSKAFTLTLPGGEMEPHLTHLSTEETVKFQSIGIFVLS